MKITHRLLALVLMILGLAAAACGGKPLPMISSVPTPTATVAIRPTASPVRRVNPTLPPLPLATEVVEVVPTKMPTDVPTPAPTSMPPSPNCTNHYTYVTDVTIPDDSDVPAGEAFTKTWRLSNTGTCTWGNGYSLAWVKGEAMSAAASIAVPATAPGETVDLSVPMTAPKTAGSYQGFWVLKTPQGLALTPELWVKIRVP